MFECVRNSNEGVLIDIHVVPNSKKEGFSYDKWEKRIKVRIREPAEDGKANKSVIRKFSEFFGNCEILSVNLSRKKVVLVKKIKIEDADRILHENLEFPQA